MWHRIVLTQSRGSLPAGTTLAVVHEPIEHAVGALTYFAGVYGEDALGCEDVDLDDLLRDVERDFGFEYANATGEAALKQLRRLIGGTPDSNMGY